MASEQCARGEIEVSLKMGKQGGERWRRRKEGSVSSLLILYSDILMHPFYNEKQKTNKNVCTHTLPYPPPSRKPDTSISCARASSPHKAWILKNPNSRPCSTVFQSLRRMLLRMRPLSSVVSYRNAPAAAATATAAVRGDRGLNEHKNEARADAK